MTFRRLFPILASVLLLSGAGCIVTKSAYDMKAAESDDLRSALASLNREKAKLAVENAELTKRVAACGEREAALAERLEGADDGSRAARSRLVDDLLKDEKATAQRKREPGRGATNP